MGSRAGDASEWTVHRLHPGPFTPVCLLSIGPLEKGSWTLVQHGHSSCNSEGGEDGPKPRCEHAFDLAENAGLDVAAVIDTISKGAAQSWQMVNRWETMHDRRFDFGFAVDWMRKDLGICLAEAHRNGSSLPIAASVNERYGEVQKNGGGRWDTSSLITLLPSNSKSEGGAN